MKTLNEKKQEVREQQNIDVATRQLLYALNNDQVAGAERGDRHGEIIIYTEGGDPISVEIQSFYNEESEASEEVDVDDSPHPQGGFSDEVWRTEVIQGYTKPYGYVGTEERIENPAMEEMDRELEEYLRDEGFTTEQIAKFLISQPARRVAETGLDKEVLDKSVDIWKQTTQS